MVDPRGVEFVAAKLSEGLMVGGLLTSGDAEIKLGSDDGVRVKVEVMLRARLRLVVASTSCCPKSLSSEALTLMRILFLNSSGEGNP